MDEKKKKKMEKFLSKTDKKMEPVLEKVKALSEKEANNKDLTKSIQNMAHILTSIFNKMLNKKDHRDPSLDASA